MIKIMKRKTDNLFLKSLENDVWVSDKKQAFEMTHREYEAAKTRVDSSVENYTQEQYRAMLEKARNNPNSS